MDRYISYSYKVLLDCWNKDATLRPNFSRIRNFFSEQIRVAATAERFVVLFMADLYLTKLNFSCVVYNRSEDAVEYVDIDQLTCEDLASPAMKQTLHQDEMNQSAVLTTSL